MKNPKRKKIVGIEELSTYYTLWYERNSGGGQDMPRITYDAIRDKMNEMIGKMKEMEKKIKKMEKKIKKMEKEAKDAKDLVRNAHLPVYYRD